MSIAIFATDKLPHATVTGNPPFLSTLPPSLSSSLLQQKLSEAQKACERVYVLEELIETLQEEQQVSWDTASSGHTQTPHVFQKS